MLRRPLSSIYFARTNSTNSKISLDAYNPSDHIEREIALERLKIFITTWNMGNAEAEGMERIFEERKVTTDYDIIVIGLQESTYTSKQNNFDSITHLQNYLTQLIGSNYQKVK